MANLKLGELVVDFEVNPRGGANSDAVDEYAAHIEEYESKGIEFGKAWEQRIEITKDKIVVKGSHTVLALRKKYDENYEVEAFYAKIGDKQANGKDDAKWLAAQSNKKGINFGDGEVSNAIIFMLEQMQPTPKSEVEGKRPFISDRGLATVIGCSRTQVNRIRKKWLKDNGFSDVVEERKTKSEDEVSETQEAANKVLEEEMAKKKKKSEPKKAKKLSDLNEEIDEIESFDFDSTEEGDEDLEGDTHPLDEHEDDIDIQDDEEPEEDLTKGDEDRDGMRKRHENEFSENLDDFIAAQPNPLIFGEIEVFLEGVDATDKGKLREFLGDKFPPAELDPVIDYLLWGLKVAADESV